MMPSLSAQIKEVWLDTAVPSSLDDMVEYQKSMAQVHEFAEKLESLQWPGVDDFYDWVTNASKIWLLKRRETSLDWTRNQLALGKRQIHYDIFRDISLHRNMVHRYMQDDYCNLSMTVKSSFNAHSCYIRCRHPSACRAYRATDGR